MGECLQKCLCSNSQYIGDQDDKQWLNENRYMPSTGGKAYLLVVSDICDIADTEEYR